MYEWEKEILRLPWYQEVYYFFVDYRFIPRIIKYIFNFIVRVIQYSPVLWKQRDWDYHYIFTLLEYKLKRVEKCLYKDKHHRYAKKYSTQVKICRLLLKRIIENNYDETCLISHYEKWGSPEFHFISSDIPGFSTLKDKRDDNLTELEKNQRWKEQKMCYKKAELMRQQDLDFFYRLFKKHHQKWWT